MAATATMTERTFNFGRFLGPTVASLTSRSKQRYIPARQQTTDGGLGGPIGSAAKSRMVLPCGYFFALGAPLYGRAGRGGRKACRMLNPVRQPRPVPLTPLGGWVRGSFNEPEFSTMSNHDNCAPARTTKAPLQFFSYDSSDKPLFSVNQDIPFEALLDHAQCFMLSVEECALNSANEVDHPSAWAAYYMAQMASGLIEAMQCSLAKESRHEQ